MADIIKEHKIQNFTPFEIIGAKKRIHQKIIINNTEIFFPYELYPNQITYMEKVIDLLNNNIDRKKNTNIAALESPTGTGKTLCLLCSTLAWMNEMRKQKKFGGKILYTTRTHSQISQTINELRKTCYWPRTAILSSRDNSCVNSKIRQNCNGNILNIKCRKNNVKCPYYNGVIQDKREKNNCLDIESLCALGKKQTFCPFYQQIENAKSYSDIIFMPYNYIFDEDINNIMDIDVENNIIIIDEAHNLRQVCEDSKSVEINEDDFDNIIDDIEKLLNIDNNEGNIINSLSNKDLKKLNLNDISKNNLELLKNIIQSIKNKFNSREINIENEGKKLTYLEFFKIFITKIENNKNKKKKKKKKIEYKDDSEDSITYNIPDNINVTNIEEHIEFLNKVENLFQECFEKGSKIYLLVKILNIISRLSNDIDLQNSYIFYIENKQIKIPNLLNQFKKIRKLNIFCFCPQLEFSDILKRNPYSIIFTSGTLIPFKIFEEELHIKFDITLENRHIIPLNQFKFEIITDYSDNNKYIFDHNNRNNTDMIKALGNQIYEYCKMTQYGGILAFFPSYNYLNKCEMIWKDSGIFNKIQQHKKLYIDSSKDKTLIKEIKKNGNKNYIFFSVFRGSSSEGIDFSDDCARMVICIGIPFANLIDKRIRLKIDYMNNKKNNNNKINSIGGNEWYLIDAMTAVNQSLGRVIRHINDYGVMICIDERYINYIKYFSFWIRENYEKYKNNINSNFMIFFNEQREKFKNEKINNNNIKSNNSNNSGFNSTITFQNNNFFQIKEDVTSEKMDIILIDNTFDNNALEIIDNKDINKNKFLVHIFDIYEDDNNQNDKLIWIESKKNEEINKKEKEANILFNKYEKEGLDLIDSLNNFLNQNKKTFNKIIDKYK